MLWVLAIVCYRTVRGAPSDEREYEHIVYENDAEELFVAPPDYTAQAAQIAADEKSRPLD
jgi:hypothetical protein